MAACFPGIFLTLFGAAVADTLIWEDQFDKLDFSKWQHEITMGGGGNWEFEWYTNNRTNSFVRDGVLYIQPTLTVDNIGEGTLLGGNMNIWAACTNNAFWGCERSANGENIINPVQSARLRTAGKFSFKYGKIEVKAQIPKGDFLWPAIWMLPADDAYGGWPASGEIDIMESRGNDASCEAGGNNKYSSTLHWGPAWDANGYEHTHGTYTHNSSLADDFHIYGLLWSKDRMMTYIDTPDNVVLDVDTSTESFWARGGFSNRDNPWVHESDVNAPFNREFYLLLNVAAGGTNGFFPDGVCGKPWSNQEPHAAKSFYDSRNSWYKTWDYPSTNQAAMKVDSIQVWELDDTLLTPERPSY